MTPIEGEIKQLRLWERVVLGVLVFFSGIFVYVLYERSLEWFEIYAGLGIVLVIFAVLVLIQHKVDQLVAILSSQVGYVQRDVFESLYEQSPVAYLMIDVAGWVIKSNPAAVSLLEGEVDHMSRVNLYDLIRDTTEVNTAVLRGKAEAGLIMNDEEVLIHSLQETEIWVLLSMFRHHEPNRRLVSLVNITEQKQVDAAKSEFVALATHQLRTPIAAIRWNAELLRKNISGEEKYEKRERYLTKIERNVFRMINLINDFLSVSKLEMGTYATQSENIELTSFFDTVLDEFSEQITTKQLIVQKNYQPADAQFATDSRLFHIIISNLISNAVKYLRPTGRLDLLYEVRGGQLQIIVADNGIGIPEEEIPQLFTKFFRASNAQSHQTEGTGLGLYVVKQSVELLGGTIEVTARSEEGTRFVVTLPR